jgi:hypothetical protein
VSSRYHWAHRISARGFQARRRNNLKRDPANMRYSDNMTRVGLAWELLLLRHARDDGTTACP